MQYLQVVGIVELDLLQWGERGMRCGNLAGPKLPPVGGRGGIMTIQELSQLFWLKREIEREYERLTQLEEAATATTPQWSGPPAAGLVADKTAIAAQIADARTVIEAKLELAVVEYNRLNRYIASIDDSLIRQIIALRFVDGLSWRQVALRAGGGNTEDSVRKAVKRYLEQERQKAREK